MIKKLNPLFIQLTAAILILSVFLMYIFKSDRSSAWFYNEYTTGGNYQIGHISFLVYGEESPEIPVKLLANAPTRLFELGGVNGPDEDENFNDAVSVKLIDGKNVGDVRVFISISYEYTESDAVPENSVFYYLFVPIIKDPEDEWYDNFHNNFEAGDYSAYLKELFSGSTMDSTAARRAAFKTQNEKNLEKLAGLEVKKDDSADLCYLIFWPEYDFAAEHDYTDWGNAEDIYREFEGTMNITIHASQYNEHAASSTP